MIKKLKEEVFRANLDLVKHNLIKFTWGNVSQIDENREFIGIKPSGVSYDDLTADDIVLVSMDGKVIDGELKPSSDTATHLELYKNFSNIKGITHTHSPWAVIFAQASKSIKCFGTTHADTFYGTIPCTRNLTKDEVECDYELNTGKVIVETFKGLDYVATPGVLCSSHGPFTWGSSAAESVYNAVVLEEVARMSYYTMKLGNDMEALQYIQDKHYFRKHGKDAYYGQ